MAERGPGFFVDLGGREPLEVTGWDALEHLAEDQRARQFQEQLDHATLYRQTFSTPSGRYVLEDFIRIFLMQRIVVPGDDQFSAGIRQGQQDVVQRILRMIEFANTGGGKPTGVTSPHEGSQP